jgi:hypothetical protein
MLSRPALFSAVLVISLPLPLQAHDIYSHLTGEQGGSCCDDRDCRPAPYRVSATGTRSGHLAGQSLEDPCTLVS